MKIESRPKRGYNTSRKAPSFPVEVKEEVKSQPLVEEEAEKEIDLDEGEGEG